MNFRIIFALITLLIASSTQALSAEVYLIQADASGWQIDGCNILQWWTDVFFHNEGSEEKTVQLLGVSNGVLPTIPEPPGTQIKIPTKKTVSLRRRAGSYWAPLPPIGRVPLWVARLEVPPEVVIEDTLFVGTLRTCHTPTNMPLYGTISLPIFRSLTPANVPKTILGADLGGLIPNRTNVGIYNASQSSEAVGKIEIRKSCDDELLEERTVTIPADTIIQFGGFGSVAANCPPFPDAYTGSAYVVVTVNQPSLTYIANVASDRDPSISVALRP